MHYAEPHTMGTLAVILYLYMYTVRVSYGGAGHINTRVRISRAISVAPRLCQVQTMELMYML